MGRKPHSQVEQWEGVDAIVSSAAHTQQQPQVGRGRRGGQPKKGCVSCRRALPWIGVESSGAAGKLVGVRCGVRRGMAGLTPGT